MGTFYLKKNDTAPAIETILSDINGAVDLTGCTVLFRMSEAGAGNLMVEKAATIVVPQAGADKGKCYAEFEAEDTAVIGEYRVEWKVTFSDGKVATFPRGEGDLFNKIIIQEIVD